MILSWNVTRRCNLACRHCYRDAGAAGPDELAASEGIRLVGEIADAGFRILILSGGEPLLREDIHELIATAAARGLRPVLGTNGTLIDGPAARRLKEAGLARAGISVDSMDPAAHDAFRGVPGSWRRTMDAISACRAEGLPFQIHTTVTVRNAAAIGAVTAFAEDAGAAAHHVFFLVPTGRGSALEKSVLQGPAYGRLVRAIARRQAESRIELKTVCAPQFAAYCGREGIATRFDRGCLAGTDYCCILPDGDVHPCPYLPIRAGSVRETPFNRLWNESGLFRTLRSRQYAGRCGRCAWKTACGGCRARAFSAGSGYLGEDPMCLFRAGSPAAHTEAAGADCGR